MICLSLLGLLQSKTPPWNCGKVSGKTCSPCKALQEGQRAVLPNPPGLSSGFSIRREPWLGREAEQARGPLVEGRSLPVVGLFEVATNQGPTCLMDTTVTTVRDQEGGQTLQARPGG